MAIAILGPALVNVNSLAIGLPGADAEKHIWSQWWVWSQISSGYGIPLQTKMIFYPDGGPFFSLDTANTLISLPLRWVFEPLTVYNLLYLFHLVAAAWSCWWLARECGLGPESSLVAGTTGIFCSWVMAFPIGSGVSETIAIFPLPLCWLFGIRMLRKPAWKAPVLCALMLLLQAAFCWSYAILASVGLAVFGLGWLSHRPWRKKPNDPWCLNRDTIQRLGLSLVIVALAIIPLYFGIQGTVSADDAVYSRALSLWPGPETPNPLTLPETNNTPLVDYILPGAMGLRISSEGVEQLMYAAYPGWLTLLAFGFGLYKGGRLGKVVGGFALLFFLLSLGPTVDIDHDRSWPHLSNPIHLLFYYVFPLFSTTIHSTDRILLALQICLGLGAAIGAQQWCSKHALPQRRWRILAICFAMLIELIVFSPAPLPPPGTAVGVHPATLRLNNHGGQGAVLDLPFMEGQQGQFYGDIFFQQTVHERPIPYRLDGIREQVVSPSLRENDFYREVEAHLLGMDQTGGSTCSDLLDLGSLGFDAIVVRTDRMSSDSSRYVIERIESCMGPLESAGNARIAWLKAETQ